MKYIVRLLAHNKKLSRKKNVKNNSETRTNDNKQDIMMYSIFWEFVVITFVCLDYATCDVKGRQIFHHFNVTEKRFSDVESECC